MQQQVGGKEVSAGPAAATNEGAEMSVVGSDKPATSQIRVRQ